MEMVSFRACEFEDDELDNGNKVKEINNKYAFSLIITCMISGWICNIQRDGGE